MSEIFDCVYNRDITGISNYIMDGGELNIIMYPLGLTPLLLALENNYYDIAETLLFYGANVNITDLDGTTLLHHLCAVGNISSILFLLQNGAYPNAIDANGIRPINLLHDSQISTDAITYDMLHSYGMR